MLDGLISSNMEPNAFVEKIIPLNFQRIKMSATNFPCAKPPLRFLSVYIQYVNDPLRSGVKISSRVGG